MVKLTALVWVLVGSSAFATTTGYEIKVELSRPGKDVSSFRTITKKNESASITQNANGEKIFIEVTATEKPAATNNAILMNFVVGTISTAGERKIISTPQIIAFENQEAKITVGNQPGKEELTLTVIAARKDL